MTQTELLGVALGMRPELRRLQDAATDAAQKAHDQARWRHREVCQRVFTASLELAEQIDRLEIALRLPDGRNHIKR